MTDPISPDPAVSRPLPIADIPPDGKTVKIVATAKEMAALAADAGIGSIESFEAEIVVKPWSRHGFRMTGRVRAAITQICVVTLEPIAVVVEEPVDLKLAPATEAQRYAREEAPEGVSTFEEEDPPDFFEGATLDPGAVAEEHFLLGVDPYPRKPGVGFDPAALGLKDEPEAPPPSPFAALAKLKRG